MQRIYIRYNYITHHLRLLSFSRKNDIKLIGYVQQIIVQNSATLDETSDYNPIEVVYESLSECFAIVNEIKVTLVIVVAQSPSMSYIQNREDYLEACLETGDINVNDENFRLFPTYSCLFLSPLQLWKNVADRFWADGNILRTVNSQKRFIKGSKMTDTRIPWFFMIASPEMFFGLPWLKTGISGVFNKKKNIKINYAITFLLKKYNPR